MSGGIYLGELRGIKIFLHWSFIILMGWMIVASWGQDRNIHHAFMTAIYIVALFSCVVLHEMGHALMARRFGIRTRDITLLPIGGVARMEKMPEEPRQEFLVAAAGPAVNVAIVAVLWLVHAALDIPLHKIKTVADLNASGILTQLMVVNGIMAVFNLIPDFPMDGGRITRALPSIKIPRVKATRIAARLGQILAVGFVIAGFYTNIWLIFIGIFIFAGAAGEAAQEEMNSELSHYRVGDLVMTEYPTLVTTDTLGSAIRRSLKSQNKEFVVLDPNGRLAGVLTMPEMLAGIAGKDETIRVAEVMRSDIQPIPAEASVMEALRILTESKIQMLPVAAAGRIMGIIDVANITEFFQVRHAIRG